MWMKVRPFLIVAPCVLSISWFIMLYFVRQLYSEFGLAALLRFAWHNNKLILNFYSWAIFHVVGADPKMKSEFFIPIGLFLLNVDIKLCIATIKS